MARDPWTAHLMLALAHRGSHRDAPENSLEAFEIAIAAGADGIETDVRLTADGVPVLFHDRLTADGAAICELTHAELNRRLGREVPTLEEAIRLPVATKSFLWNIEIKTPSVVLAVRRCLADYLGKRRFLVTSFWHEAVSEICESLPVQGGLLMASRPLPFDARPPWMPISPRVDSIVFHVEMVDAELVKRCRASGVSTYVYGAISRQEHDAIRDFGVDGIITDYLEYLASRP